MKAIIAVAVFVFLLAMTACGTTRIFTRLIAAPCPVRAAEAEKEEVDPKLYEHVPEHRPKVLSCEECTRLANARLESVQQCNAKLDKLKAAGD